MSKKTDVIKNPVQTLFRRINASPTAFHVVENMRAALEEKGFSPLAESEPWSLKKGGRYYVTRNDSSIIAFVIPDKKALGFRITASHSDSPTFRIKEAPEMESAGYIRLNVERYGGMLCAPWFDRPLSVAGRVIVREGKGRSAHLASKLVDLDRDLLMLPSLAIHMNREANDGIKYNAQKDLLPLMGDASDKTELLGLIAETLGVKKEDILGNDLFLYVRDNPVIWGDRSQYISSPRLDDQECAWCSLDGFLAADNPSRIMVHCVFDNEEVGSRTKQGAASTFLDNVLRRISLGLGRTEEEHLCAVSDSFMISADNAHAVHPAYPDKADPVHHPRMNGGIVLKYSANQSYTTDGASGAVVRLLCEKNRIPMQLFFNRSDSPGGSTLGNISNTQVSMNTADIGLAQLAMHSPYETAGVEDIAHMTAFLKAFFSVEDIF